MSLKEMRKKNGLKQSEAAEIFGLKYRTYQNYENGVTSPDMDTAARFARYFGCTIGDLFDLKEGVMSLSSDEQRLLNMFRSLSPTAKELFLKVVLAIYDGFQKLDREDV